MRCAVTALSAQSFQRSYAIVVGVHTYKVAGSLPNARNDAESIAELLKSQGYHVKELYDENATKAAIIDAMDTAAQQLTPHDRILFFFAGHGTTLIRGQKDWGYIVPYDGRPPQTSTLISMEELQTQSEQMGNAAHQLFLMDSCYGGKIGRDIPGGSVPRGGPNYLGEITSRIARQALTAGGKNQSVEDGAGGGHSVFTAALLEALKDGKADTQGDGIITFNDLAAYVLRRAATRWQTPAAVVLPGDGLGEYWFVSPKGKSEAIRSRDPAGRPREDTGTAAVNTSDPLRNRVADKLLAGSWIEKRTTYNGEELPKSEFPSRFKIEVRGQQVIKTSITEAGLPCKCPIYSWTVGTDFYPARNSPFYPPPKEIKYWEKAKWEGESFVVNVKWEDFNHILYTKNGRHVENYYLYENRYDLSGDNSEMTLMDRCVEIVGRDSDCRAPVVITTFERIR